MRHSWFSAIAIGALAVGSSRAEAMPADVAAIDRVSKAIESNAHLTGDDAERALLDEYTRLVVIQAAWIAEAQGIGELTEVRSPDFVAYAKRYLRPQVKAAAGEEAGQLRKDKWYEILRLNSTESAGHRLLAAWLDFEAPGSYLGKAKRGDPPRITEQISAISSDPRLKILEDQVTLGGEIGGAGEGNSVIDAGEWVNLGLQVYNDDERGFFSSSAWVDTPAECAWAPPAFEIVMSELPATPKEGAASEDKGKKLSLKKKAIPVQLVEAWVYLSKTCSDGAVVPLQIQIKDTHRAPEVPIVVAAKMNVRNRTMGRATDFLVDTDVPGVSDGRSMPAVTSARVFELTHRFKAPEDGLLSARTGWGVHDDVGSIIREQAMPTEPMIDDAEGRFLSGDDLDISTVKRSDFDRILQARADKFRWRSVDDARAWFAADTEVLYETPDPPTEVVEEIPDEVCDNYIDDDGDGDHDCDDSDCKAEPVCNPAEPVAVGPLMALLKKNVDIVANPAPTTLPGAVDAVEPGYELVVDSDEIARQYRCLVLGISPEQCDACEGFDLSLEDCKTCVDEGTDLRTCGLEIGCEEEEEVKTEEVNTSRDPAVAYSYRNYFTLPLAWNPIESEDYGNCDDDWDNDLDGLTDARDPDCRRKDPLGHRFDFGLLAGRVGLTDGPTMEWATASPGQKVWMPMLNVRYVLIPRSGGAIRPMASYGYGLENATVIGGANTLSHRSIGAGLVYHMGLSDSLGIEARGLVNNRTYSIAPQRSSGYSNEESTIGFELGLEVHYQLASGLGFHAGLGGVLHGPITEEAEEILVTDPIAVTAGVNWTFGQ